MYVAAGYNLAWRISPRIVKLVTGYPKVRVLVAHTQHVFCMAVLLCSCTRLVGNPTQ